MRHCCVQIVGKVQGVAFRYYTRLKAKELGLLGTVENQVDGSVVAFVFGDDSSLDILIEWFHKGSPASKVDDVIVSELAASENVEYKDFSILR